MREMILVLMSNVCYLAITFIFLVVTWWLLLVTQWLLLVTWCLLVVTARQRSILLLSTFSMNTRNIHTPSNNNSNSQFAKNTTFQSKVFKLSAGVTKEISKPGFLSSFEVMCEIRRYVKYNYLPALNDQIFMPFIQSYQSQKTRYIPFWSTSFLCFFFSFSEIQLSSYRFICQNQLKNSLFVDKFLILGIRTQ